MPEEALNMAKSSRFYLASYISYRITIKKRLRPNHKVNDDIHVTNDVELAFIL